MAMDQKVAIIIAVLVLILSFVWRPGVLVPVREYYTFDKNTGKWMDDLGKEIETKEITDSKGNITVINSKTGEVITDTTEEAKRLGGVLMTPPNDVTPISTAVATPVNEGKKDKRGRSNYEIEQPMQVMDDSSVDFETYSSCDATWWAGKCNRINELDFEPGETIVRPRDIPVDELPPEYQPMSPEGTRRVLGPPSDENRMVLPVVSAWDNSNEV